MSTRRNFLRSILVSLLVLAPISTWADSSRVDLFRFGNASSPRLDNVRTTDLSTTQRNGESAFRHLSRHELVDWLADYRPGELWEKGVLGGSPVA